MGTDWEHLKRIGSLRKLEAGPAELVGAAAGGVVTAIVRVSEPEYVPAGVQVRARISPTLFTGEFAADLLCELEADAKVQAVSLARSLHSNE